MSAGRDYDYGMKALCGTFYNTRVRLPPQNPFSTCVEAVSRYLCLDVRVLGLPSNILLKERVELPAVFGMRRLRSVAAAEALVLHLDWVNS